MVRILGEEEQSIRILGEDPTEVEEQQSPEVDPFAAAMRRLDESLIVATGELPEDSSEAKAGLRQETETAIMEAVKQVLTGEQAEPKSATERLIDVQETGETVLFSDYWALERQALAEQDPEFGGLQALSALKFQYMVETLEDNIRKSKGEGPNAVVSFVDRYFLRNWPIGIAERLMAKGQKEGDEFLAALSGTMSFEDFKVFLDTKITEYSEQGVLVGDNRFALQELLSDAARRGDESGIVADRLLAIFEAAFPMVPLSSVPKSAKALKALSRARTTATQAGITGGHKAATNAAESIARVTDEVENLSGMTVRILDPVADEAPVRPLMSAAQDAQTAKELYDEVFTYTQRALGDSFDIDLLKTRVKEKADFIAKSVNRPLNDVLFDFRNNSAVIRIGNFRTGDAVTERTAKKIAEGIPNSSVVNVGKDKYVVEIKEVMNTDAFNKIKQEPVEEIGNAISRWTSNLTPSFLKGSYLRDADELTNLAQRAESGEVKIKEAVAAWGRDADKMSGRDFDEVGRVVSELQSGSLSSNRSWFDEETFKDVFKKVHGRNPTNRQVKGYLAVTNLSDYAYVTKGWLLVRNLQRQGFRQITVKVGEDLQPVAARKVSELPENVTHVMVGSTGQIVEIATYKGPKSNIFAMDFEVGNGFVETRHVVDVDTIRPLEPRDVLGYNAGGSRINPNANHFISFEVDGKIVRVAMSTTSRKEANLASKEIQTLMDAAREGRLTDELVQNNRSWYTSGNMDKVDDFLRLAQEEGWDLTKKVLVNRRERDSKTFVSSADDVFIQDGTLEDYFTFSGRRNDRPLLHYGGARTYNDNPIKSVVNQVNSVNRQIAQETYNNAATASLGQAVKQIVPHQAGYGIRDYYYNMESLLAGSTEDLPKLLLERKRIFELRRGVKTGGEEWAQGIADKATEALYNLTGLNVKIGGPADTLTRFGFYRTFFGDVFQLVLQGSQVGALAAMHGTLAWKGANIGYMLKSSLDLPHGSPEFNLMMKNMADTFGLSLDDVMDLRETFADIGRYEIDPSGLAEGFENASFSVSGVNHAALRVAGNNVGKAWDSAGKAGMYFFNKGEQASRVTAFGLSALLWKRANPTGRLNSKTAKAWISNKEQALTLNMNQSNKARIQQGLLKVPTQFYSFLLRTFEGVFIGKNLTQKERMALFAYMGPLWGMTGLGLHEAADSIIDFYGMDKDSVGAETIRNGPIEALLDWTFGGEFDVALAGRLSIGDAISDIFRSFQDKSTLEMLAGAGGGKFGSFSYNLLTGLASVATGKPYYGSTQLAEALRETKLIDNLSKAYGVYADDVYTSKTGKVIRGLDLSVWETLGIALGVPSGEVQDFYEFDSIRYGQEKDYVQRAKAVDTLINSFYNALEGNDSEKATRVLAELEAIIVKSNLTEEQKSRLRNRVMNGAKEKTTFDLYIKLMRLGLTAEAESFAELVGI